MTQHHDFNLCGWRLRSELPLPELLPWNGAPAAPDIEICIGSVLESVDDDVEVSPQVRIGPDGAVRFVVRGVGRYQIAGGSRIVIDPMIGLDAPDLSLYLFGTVFGVLCHQRGLLPLHASCLAAGDSAVAFAGRSGSGKSTIAALLLRRGYRLLADDVTVIQMTQGMPVVLPSFPKQKLWGDTLNALRLSPGRKIRTLENTDKFELAVADSFESQPRPLAAIYHLHANPLPDDGEMRPIQALTGLRALHATRGAVYRVRAGIAISGTRQIFSTCSAIAGCVPQFMVRRPEGLHAFGKFADGLSGLLDLAG